MLNSLQTSTVVILADHDCAHNLCLQTLLFLSHWALWASFCLWRMDARRIGDCKWITSCMIELQHIAELECKKEFKTRSWHALACIRSNGSCYQNSSCFSSEKNSGPSFSWTTGPLRQGSLSTNRFGQTTTNYYLQTSSWWVACCSFCGKQYLSRKQGWCDIAWALRHSTDPSIQTWQVTQAQPFNMLTCSTTPMLRRICWVGLVLAPPFARSAIQVTRAVLQTLWFSLRMQRSWMKVK